MSKRLDENLGSVGYDGLIVANEPVADVFTVTIRKEATAAATYKRGTVLDDNALKERQGGQELSVAESSLLLYAAVEDLPARRPAGEGLNVDGREYIVNDWSEDMGIATVALGQTVTM